MNLFFPLAILASLAVSPIPDYQPREEIHQSFYKKNNGGEIVFDTGINFELSRFISNDCKLITMDANYGCLPEDVTRKLVALALFDFDNHYIVEARDCDDLALEFIVKFRKSFREFTDNVPLACPAGLIGVKIVADIPEMKYILKGDVSYHAIVIVRCEGGKWLLVDPGTKKVSEFTGHLYEGTMELRLAIF